MRVELLLSGRERREEQQRQRQQPVASAAEALRLLPEAGSGTHTERGGPRGDGLHDSLTVLSPPPVHLGVGPPLTVTEESVTVKSIPLHVGAANKKKKKRENLILFLK